VLVNRKIVPLVGRMVAEGWKGIEAEGGQDEGGRKAPWRAVGVPIREGLASDSGCELDPWEDAEDSGCIAGRHW
jgi:hypothetical protein